MIALAAVAAAAPSAGSSHYCMQPLPFLPLPWLLHILHFLLPQDAATKTASKLLKLQQI